LLSHHTQNVAPKGMGVRFSLRPSQLRKVTMARMLKRWESPRREGRNHKGKGGSARQRQLKKQTQMLRKKLQEGLEPEGKQGEN
jgi:hypothetical protein